MAEKKKPGDLSHLGRTDPVKRDASWFPYRLNETRTPEYSKKLEKNYGESVRREFRQSEDAGEGHRTKRRQEMTTAQMRKKM